MALQGIPRGKVILRGNLHSSDDMRYLQANFGRIKWRGMQTMSKDFMPETFLQRVMEKAIRDLLGVPGQELCGTAAVKKGLSHC